MADLLPTSHDRATVRMPWGLHLLSDATSDASQRGVAVDIIAVHGLGANPDHAWVRHKDATAGLEKDVRWLTDLLPQTFREHQPSISARIFCFNYQSAWLGPRLSKNRLEDLATRLLDDIHNVRHKNGALSNQPIIFIGHSFGGLVIEQAVVQANSAGGRYEYLVKLIGGVILLGTPHHGSKSQKWGSIIATLANVINYGESGLMDEVDEKSMKIFDLISEFKKIMISIDLAKTAVICFYEDSPTDYLSRVVNTGPWIQRQTSSMVVEDTSAKLSGFHSVPLNSDHLKLNKFASAQEGNYVSVSSNLCRIAAEAPGLIRGRRKGTASSHFLVSRERVKDFIGRDSLLDQIRSHFFGDQTGLPPILILHALGGQGKSQIALEYCRRWRRTYRGVFWIIANSETTVTQSYGAIAAELGGPQIQADDSTAQIKYVKGCLEQWSEAWLLVFDNYDNPDTFSEIRQFIPTEGHGHVIFTSRNRDLSRLGRLMEIPPMATEEGVRLLLRGYNDEEIQPQHRDTAASIIDRLGKLALAIDQAAAYIKYKRIPLDLLNDFLTKYEAERRRILSYTPKKLWEYRSERSQGQAQNISAFTTWEMSFQQLESGDEAWKREDAAHFLTLSAFLAPTSITESLFRFYQERHGGEIDWMNIFTVTDEIEDVDNDDDADDDDKAEEEEEEEVGDGNEDEDEDEVEDRSAKSSSSGGVHGTWDAEKYWDVIAKSAELSLLQSISPGTGLEGARFSLHPLIRDWLQLRLKAKERQNHTQEAIEVLACCMKEYNTRSTTMEERTALITHMDVSLSNDEKFVEPQDRLGRNIASCDMASWFAQFYYNEGRYRTSEALWRHETETRRNILSERDPSTLRSMQNLALFQAKYEEAESMQRQILTLREAVLGENHVDTLFSKTRLAYILESRGQREESEKLLRQTMTCSGMFLGNDHPSTLVTLGSLAWVLNHQGKRGEAELIYRQVLVTSEKILGKEHPNTSGSMNNLANILSDQGKYAEAERLYRSALTMKEKVSGREHPATLKSIYNLAILLRRKGEYEDAERLCREVLTLRERASGKEHIDTLYCIEFLSDILSRQGKYEEAERICQELLTLRERVSGKEHTDTLYCIELLGCILRSQRKYEEAEKMFRDLLTLRRKVLGREHPDTLYCIELLCSILRSQGKYEEAEKMCRDLLTLRRKVLGREHPDTLYCIQLLGRILRRQGKYEEAERISRDLLTLREKALGKEHPDTLYCIEFLGDILRRQGKSEEAEDGEDGGDGKDKEDGEDGEDGEDEKDGEDGEDGKGDEGGTHACSPHIISYHI